MTTSSSPAGLVASDIMQRDVITIRPQDTLRDALSLMMENHVTGLPVMDQHSTCVGLITATDILSYEQEHADEADERGEGQYFDPDTQQWSSVQLTAFALEEMADIRVEEVMVSDLITVQRDASAQEVARKMLKAGVHRVLVMDDKNKLYGIVSAVDFVRLAAEK